MREWVSWDLWYNFAGSHRFGNESLVGSLWQASFDHEIEIDGERYASGQQLALSELNCKVDCRNGMWVEYSFDVSVLINRKTQGDGERSNTTNKRTNEQANKRTNEQTN